MVLSHPTVSADVPDLIVLGNVTIDDLVFVDGSTRMNQPGGNAVYAMHGALLWGVRVGLCAVAGAGYPARLLARPGLDLSGLQAVDGPSLRNWGLYEDDNTCQYIFRGVFGPDAHARFSPLPTGIPAAFRTARYAHLAPVPYERALALLAVLDGARRSGGVSVDPDVRYLAALTPSERDALLAGLTFFMPSLREVTLLYPGLAPIDVLRRVRDAYPGVRVAVVKLAAEGVLVYDRVRDDIIHLPAAPAAVVDTTGAGDAFCGGFLAGYALSEDGVEAVMHGLVSASFIVESYGVPAVAPPLQKAEERLVAYRRMVGGARADSDQQVWPGVTHPTPHTARAGP